MRLELTFIQCDIIRVSSFLSVVKMTRVAELWRRNVNGIISIALNHRTMLIVTRLSRSAS